MPLIKYEYETKLLALKDIECQEAETQEKDIERQEAEDAEERQQAQEEDDELTEPPPASRTRRSTSGCAGRSSRPAT